jgi:hypothetical protein
MSLLLLVHLYADDTILYTSGPSLDTVLTNLQTSYNTTNPSSITTLDGSDLEYVDNYKYLGVRLDCKLSIQTHTQHPQYKFNLISIHHSCCQTYPRKTAHPTDLRLWLCHLQEPPTLYSTNWMQSFTVPSVLSPKPHILPTTATCTLSLAGPRFILVAKPTGSRSSTSLC